MNIIPYARQALIWLLLAAVTIGVMPVAAQAEAGLEADAAASIAEQPAYVYASAQGIVLSDLTIETLGNILRVGDDPTDRERRSLLEFPIEGQQELIAQAGKVELEITFRGADWGRSNISLHHLLEGNDGVVEGSDYDAPSDLLHPSVVIAKEPNAVYKLDVTEAIQNESSPYFSLRIHPILKDTYVQNGKGDSNKFALSSEAEGTTRLVITPKPATPERPTLSIAAPSATVTEGVYAPDAFVVSRQDYDAIDEPVLATYAVSGSATSGEDYSALEGEVILPAGERSVSIGLDSLADDVVDLDETVIVELTETEAYSLLEFSQTASVLILDSTEMPKTEFLKAADRRIELEEGDSYELQYVLFPEHSTSSTLQFTSLNSAIASVDADGTITANRPGYASIQLRNDDGSLEDYVTVVVNYRDGVKNGGFETESLEQWEVAGDIAVQRDSTFARFDDWSLKASTVDGTNGNVAQRMNVVAGTSYWVSAWMKTEVAAGDGAVAAVRFLDGQDAQVGERTPLIQSSGQTDWTIGQEVIEAPVGAAYMEVSFGLDDAEGSVWLDGIEMKQSLTEQIVDASPKILVNEADVQVLKDRLAAQEEPYYSWYYGANGVKAQADQIVANGPDMAMDERGLDGRMNLLGLVYLVSGDGAYAEAAWAQLERFIALPKWDNPDFLDAGEAAHGFAIAYDWFRDYWTDERKSVLREQVVTKGFIPVLVHYRGDPTLGKTIWAHEMGNWNTVCNGGMLMAAMAFGDDPNVRPIAEEILHKGLNSLVNGLHIMSIDGASSEGVGYWNYNMTKYVPLVESIERAFGHDMGISSLQGIATAGDFPIQMTGAKGIFNFNDSDFWARNGVVELYYFASKYRKPHYMWYANQFNTGASPLKLLWYDKTLGEETSLLRLDAAFRGGFSHVVSMRNNWLDAGNKMDGQALSLQAKAGDHDPKGHRDMDYGTFVLDALGERWAEDLGKDKYGNPYFDYKVGRWTFYRKRPEGHNTIVINPDERVGQTYNGTTYIERSSLNVDNPFTIFDLSDVYSDYNAYSARRGFRLLHDRSQAFVQDEIHLGAGHNEVYWFMHLKVKPDQIEIQDGGKSAVVTKGGKRLWMHLATDAGSFEVMKAESLPSSPAPGNPALVYANDDYRKLAVHLDGVSGMQRIQVFMIPLAEGDLLPDPAKLPVIGTLDQWGQPEESVLYPPAAKLSSITVNGEPLEHFSPSIRNYEVSLDSGEQGLPHVEGETLQEGVEVDVEQPPYRTGTAIIRAAHSSDGWTEGVYSVTFRQQPELGVNDQVYAKLPVSRVWASGEQNEQFIAANVIDGSLAPESRWSAAGEQWIAFDLGEVRRVDAVSAAWFKGDERSTNLRIEVSQNDIDWHPVYEGLSSGDTSEFELYGFLDEQARYVRLVANGSETSIYNSILEMGIHSRNNGDGDSEGPQDGEGNSSPPTIPSAESVWDRMERTADRLHLELKENEGIVQLPLSTMPADYSFIDIQWQQGSVQLPKALMQELLSMAGEKGWSEPGVEVKLSRVEQRENGDIALSRGSATSAGDVYLVAITVKGENERLSYDTFTQPIQLRMKLSPSVNGNWSRIYEKSKTGQTWVPVATSYDANEGLLIAELDHAGQFGPFLYDPDYRDAQPQHWAYDAIRTLSARMIVQGNSEGQFMPEQSLTRAELAAIAVRAFGLNQATEASSGYRDVEPGAWYASDVEAAFAAGLMLGDGNGRFRPDEPITREELSVIVNRVIELLHDNVAEETEDDKALDVFEDNASVSAWAAKAMQRLIELGLLIGDDQGRLNPLEEVTRAEGAQLINRFIQYTNE